jgi:hypothetical protein
MKNLNIEATQSTPNIDFDVSGKLSITGKSYPENTFEFYAPVMNWVKTYFATDSSPRELTLDIEITYFNTSSSKLFFDFFDFFNHLDKNQGDFNVTVNWIYDEENESALEAGEDFVDDFENLNIKLVPKDGQTALLLKEIVG